MSGVKNVSEADFESMRKNSVGTRIHVDMYWNVMQGCQIVLNLGSVYGFLEEESNSRSDKKFNIEENEIGQFRPLCRWQGLYN